MAKVFKFALVARGTTPLAKYPADDAELYGTAMAMLRKLDSNAPFSVVEQHNLLFTASTTQGGMSFVCLCEKNVETRRVGQFLSNLKGKWIQSYGAASSEMAEAAKDDEFRAQLKDLIGHYNEICPPPDERPAAAAGRGRHRPARNRPRRHPHRRGRSRPPGGVPRRRIARRAPPENLVAEVQVQGPLRCRTRRVAVHPPRLVLRRPHARQMFLNSPFADQESNTLLPNDQSFRRDWRGCLILRVPGMETAAPD
jgi:hypothetical protein